MNIVGEVCPVVSNNIIAKNIESNAALEQIVTLSTIFISLAASLSCQSK